MKTLVTSLLSGLTLTSRAPAIKEAALPFDGPLPQQIDAAPIINTERIILKASRNEILPWIINVPLENIFAAYGSLPEVVRTVPITDHWAEVGSRRRVILADGHQAAEEILSISEDEQFTYMVFGFTNAAGALAKYAIGQFTLADHPDGTEVIWTYSFFPKNWLTRIPLSIFISQTWDGYMEVSINNLKQQIFQSLGGE